jgi:hypothetical protein
LIRRANKNANVLAAAVSDGHFAAGDFSDTGVPNVFIYPEWKDRWRAIMPTKRQWRKQTAIPAMSWRALRSGEISLREKTAAAWRFSCRASV